MPADLIALVFRKKDVRNFIDLDRRSIAKGGDGKEIFFSNPRSIALYEYFRDVVNFDTTYLTNKNDMPFVAFVGVNHHGQSVLLECGLLNSKEKASFVWKALQHTRHKLLLWHIMKKLRENLKGYGCYEEIQVTMSEVVYQSLTIEEFEDNWTGFVNAYCLEDNEWLQGMRNDRRCWIPVYLKGDFRTTLAEFVTPYNNALMSRVKKEAAKDFDSLNKILPCCSNNEIEGATWISREDELHCVVDPG
ncbi:protein FAR1-RELATED SEQUENCE 5-like [Arachis hypogaea]|uniref:protein FAR1-RELATED SEQUENCE 5-like n=1 Tax=Arachis hypogaea TaxID=3818 RepID=UPI000DEC20D8|nr:protein FAR1-RELATED SEQUENCE 5-like [Arachis hypogaea]